MIARKFVELAAGKLLFWLTHLNFKLNILSAQSISKMGTHAIIVSDGWLLMTGLKRKIIAGYRLMHRELKIVFVLIMKCHQVV